MRPARGIISALGDRIMTRTFISTALAAAVLAYGAPASVKDSVATVHVDATPGHAINSFDPDS